MDDDAPGLARAAPLAAEDREISREILRSRRKREVRAKTVNVQRLTLRERRFARVLFPEAEMAKVQAARPKTREECRDHVGPCPFVSCKHHLYLDVSARTGAIKLNFPDLEPDELRESCALDVADRGGETPEEVGAIMNLTRERIRQLEVKALAVVAPFLDPVRDHAPEGGEFGRRRLPMLREETSR